MRKFRAVSFAFTLLFFTTIPIINAQEYQPSVGQSGKDVIWVPTPDDLVEAMLDLAKVTSKDFVVDLGSGDGRIVIAAAKRGAHAVGFEYNPDMVALSRRNAEKAGVSARATFENADIFASDFSKATVVTMYLLPNLNLKLRPTILNMKPGTRVVSHAFNMGDWPADKTVEKEYRTAYFWIVPARVEGLWTWQADSGKAELNLTQKFQSVGGSLKIDGKQWPVEKGKIEGESISFAAGNQEYTGKVNGNSIQGSVRASSARKWSATRIAD